MNALTGWGIFCVGFVFGYLLYYSVRHTKEFSIELLSAAIGAIGGGTVIAFLGKTEGWIGPYGLGIGAGFVVYGMLAFALILHGKFAKVADTGVMLRQTLLGTPKHE